MAKQKAEERIYIVPLRKAKYRAPRTKRAAKAMRFLRRFISKHMKADKVKITQRLNERLWERGISYVPSRLKVRAKREKKEGEEYVVVDLAE